MDESGVSALCYWCQSEQPLYWQGAYLACWTCDHLLCCPNDSHGPSEWCFNDLDVTS